MKKKQRKLKLSCLKTGVYPTVSPLNYNDPFDSHLKITNKLITLLFNQHMQNPKFADIYNKKTKQEKKELKKELYGIIRQNKESIKDDLFILKNSQRSLCFSELKDSILMWSHYGKSHTGFCVEYNMKQLNEYETRYIFPVFYSDEMYDLSEQLYDINLGKSTKSMTAFLFSLIKYEGWSYEKEWRLFNLSDINNNSIKLPMIKSIYLGNNISKNDENDLIDIAKNRNYSVYQTTLHNEKFSLEFKKVDI